MSTQDVERLLSGQVGFILATVMFLITGLVVGYFILRWLVVAIKEWVASNNLISKAMTELAQANREFMAEMKDRDKKALTDLLIELKTNHNGQ